MNVTHSALPRNNSAIELNTNRYVQVQYDNGQIFPNGISKIAQWLCSCSWLTNFSSSSSLLESHLREVNKALVSQRVTLLPSSLCYRLVGLQSSEVNKILQLVQWVFNQARYSCKFLSKHNLILHIVFSFLEVL